MTHKYKILIFSQIRAELVLGWMPKQLELWKTDSLGMGFSAVGDGVQLGRRQRKPGHFTESQLSEGSVDNHNTGLGSRCIALHYMLECNGRV